MATVLKQMPRVHCLDPEQFTYWDSADDLAGLLDQLRTVRSVVGGMSQSVHS
jgi:hypothetical protein